MASKSKFGHPDVDRIVQAYKEFEELHQRVFPLVQEIAEKVKAGRYEKGTMADIGFLFKCCEKFMEECRKDSKALRTLVGKMLAFQLTKESLANPDNPEDVVLGTVGKAVPDQRMNAGVPKKGSDEYVAFLESCGVPMDIIQKGVIDIKWNGLGDLVSELTRQGKKLPPGITKTYPEFVCRFLKKPGSSVGLDNLEDE